MLGQVILLSGLVRQAEDAAAAADPEYREAFERTAAVWRGLLLARTTVLAEIAREAEEERERFLAN